MGNLIGQGVSIGVAFLLAASPSSASDTQSESATATADLQAMKQSVQTIRNLGAALYERLEEIDPSVVVSQSGPPEVMNWGDCRSVPAAEIGEILESMQDRELAFDDGWGHPLEFCLVEDSDSNSWYRVGIRTPGKDGKYQGTEYEPGPFLVTEVDRDIVWINGYFWTYPGR